MNQNLVSIQNPELNLAQLTIRIRQDQKRRLDIESQARGIKVADVLRDNLDLAFAMKEELAKIVEGEYDENDPCNAPRLVHSLLFRVEERILGALDSLALRFEKQLNGSQRSMEYQPLNNPFALSKSKNPQENNVAQIVDGFISLIAESNNQPPEAWVGAVLEIAPRLDLVDLDQLSQLKHKGGLWLEKQGYYAKNY